MNGYKQFLDRIFNNIDINELAERHKCKATGKINSTCYLGL